MGVYPEMRKKAAWEEHEASEGEEAESKEKGWLKGFRVGIHAPSLLASRLT